MAHVNDPTDMQFEIAGSCVFSNPSHRHRNFRCLGLHSVDESKQERRFNVSKSARPVRLNFTVLDPFSARHDPNEPTEGRDCVDPAEHEGYAEAVTDPPIAYTSSHEVVNPATATCDSGMVPGGLVCCSRSSSASSSSGDAGWCLARGLVSARTMSSYPRCRWQNQHSLSASSRTAPQCRHARLNLTLDCIVQALVRITTIHPLGCA